MWTHRAGVSSVVERRFSRLLSKWISYDSSQNYDDIFHFACCSWCCKRSAFLVAGLLSWCTVTTSTVATSRYHVFVMCSYMSCVGIITVCSDGKDSWSHASVRHDLCMWLLQVASAPRTKRMCGHVTSVILLMCIIDDHAPGNIDSQPLTASSEFVNNALRKHIPLNGSHWMLLLNSSQSKSSWSDRKQTFVRIKRVTCGSAKVVPHHCSPQSTKPFAYTFVDSCNSAVHFMSASMLRHWRDG